jgi:hypothetical protein
MKKIISFTSTSHQRKIYSSVDNEERYEPVLIYTALTEDGELYQIHATDRGIPPDKNWIKIKGIPDDEQD